MRRPAKLWGIAFAALLATAVVPPGAGAEQAAQPGLAAAGRIDAGKFHSCAVLPTDASLRCWGYGGDGALGYGNRLSIGDDETPAAVGPVRVGTVAAIGAGAVHSCALIDDAGVRCWGFGGDGRLGYANTVSIGDDEPPDTVGLVAVGGAATAITAGRAHSCAILADGTVRCWGFNFDGRLGYPDPAVNPAIGPRPPSIGDTETPAEAGPVALGGAATAITAGDAHTCAILVDSSVRCWGFAGNGQLGNASVTNVGDDEPPDAVPPVPLGAGASAIAAGDFHSCAIVAGGSVRCWGFGGNGRLGLGNQETVGDNEPASAVGFVDLGPGRTARAITAGEAHTCAILDDGTVRCWGNAASGQLGYGTVNPSTNRPENIGDSPDEVATAGPVPLGEGRTAVAISAGGDHTCARLDDGSVRCWGRGLNGEIGNCVPGLIGDNETPADSGPVDFGIPGAPGATCPIPVPPAPPAPAAPSAPAPALPAVPNLPATPSLPGAGAALDAALRAEAARASDLRACRARADRSARAQRSRARRLIRRRASVSRALRAIAVRAGRRRASCMRRFSRRPARVRSLTARALPKGRVILTFQASGSNGMALPAARRYVVKQSRRPIRTTRDFRRADSLCRGSCRFDVTQPRSTLSLTVTDLRRRRTYHYAVAALDNVSGRRGPRSRTVRVRAR